MVKADPMVGSFGSQGTTSWGFNKVGVEIFFTTDLQKIYRDEAKAARETTVPSNPPIVKRSKRKKKQVTQATKVPIIAPRVTPQPKTLPEPGVKKKKIKYRHTALGIMHNNQPA